MIARRMMPGFQPVHGAASVLQPMQTNLALALPPMHAHFEGGCAAEWTSPTSAAAAAAASSSCAMRTAGCRLVDGGGVNLLQNTSQTQATQTWAIKYYTKNCILGLTWLCNCHAPAAT
jgi:hypothetical protein